MDLVGNAASRRGGTRGGRDQFKWDDIKEDKDRENYLGNSLKAPVGRWQKGKDLLWYTKKSENEEDMNKPVNKDKGSTKVQGEHKEDRNGDGGGNDEGEKYNHTHNHHHHHHHQKRRRTLSKLDLEQLKREREETRKREQEIIGEAINFGKRKSQQMQEEEHWGNVASAVKKVTEKYANQEIEADNGGHTRESLETRQAGSDEERKRKEEKAARKAERDRIRREREIRRMEKNRRHEDNHD